MVLRRKENREKQLTKKKEAIEQKERTIEKIELIGNVNSSLYQSVENLVMYLIII